MKVTGLALVPPPTAADLPKVTPELLASVLARYSRSNQGIGAILSKVDLANPDASIDRILNFVDYGHGRVRFVANYEAVLGEELRNFDPNQGNYLLDLSASSASAGSRRRWRTRRPSRRGAASTAPSSSACSIWAVDSRRSTWRACSWSGRG